jgi:hypothetical protein
MLKTLIFGDEIGPCLQVQLFRVVFPIVTNCVFLYVTLSLVTVDQSCCPTLCVLIFNTERWAKSTKWIRVPQILRYPKILSDSWAILIKFYTADPKLLVATVPNIFARAT